MFVRIFYALIFIQFLFYSPFSYAMTHHKVVHPKKIILHSKKKVIKKSTLVRKKNSHPPTRIFTHKVKSTVKINKANARINLPANSLNVGEKKLVHYIQKNITSAHSNAYLFGGNKIDTRHGVYKVDCSRYVDYVLKNIYPRAFANLVSSSHMERPTTYDFYQYFKKLKSRNQKHWRLIKNVKDLRPGDILVFRYKNAQGKERGGHVMFVMDKPIKRAKSFAVRVADSAHSGHSKDTRPPHSSGIGIGLLALKIHPDSAKPYAFAWKVGSSWKTHVKMAMARPLRMDERG